MIDPKHIFTLRGEADFEAMSLEIFKFQATACKVYQDYLRFLGITPSEVNSIRQIPFLPIELFKTQQIKTADKSPEIVFQSSGTTGMQTSRHEVLDLSLYTSSFRKAFDQVYGNIENITLLALLPSYQERNGSSLIYMIDDLIVQSRREKSGYFLYNHEELHQTLLSLKNQNTQVILLGVTYALLDFSEKYHLSGFNNLIVMETGGMKGRRKEMVREELHDILQEAYGVKEIHSEYGMTELLSQAYSTGNGRFTCPPWMRVLTRETNDPFSYTKFGQSGGINVIDLANLYSCSFLSTQDLGRTYENGDFEVLGRFDNSDIRGCNLLVT